MPQPEKTSDNASSSAKRRRTKFLDKTRQLLSGGSEEAVDAQLTDETKLRESQDHHQKNLDRLNLQQIHIPDGNLLTLKADLFLNQH